MYVAFYDDRILADEGSVIRDSTKEVLTLLRAKVSDPQWDLLTIYELSEPIYTDGESIELPANLVELPPELEHPSIITDYAGYTIKKGQEEAWLLTKNGANVMPAAAAPLTREDCFMAADVLQVVDGDGRKFWHLWRAIRGTDERESHSHKHLRRAQ